MFSRIILFVALLGPLHSTLAADMAAAASKHFPQIKWDSKTVLQGDFDCDGKRDAALLGEDKKSVWVAIFNRGPEAAPQTLSFPKSVMCNGKQRHLKADALDVSDAEWRDTLGEVPEGYRTSKTCQGLALQSGECDSLHIYWNHVKRKFYAWTL